MSDFMAGDAARDPGRVLSAIVDASEDAIIVKTLDGVIVSWSRGAEHLYGYAEQDVMGRSIAMMFPDDRQGELERILADIRAGHRVDYHDTVRRRKDGRLIDVRLTVTPVIDAAGRPIAGVTLARNITAQVVTERALETSEQRWRAIIASAVDGIIVIDARGLIESANPAAERLFGYRESELIGRNVSVLMPSPHREEHDAYIARYLRTGEAQIIGRGREVHGTRRDGTTFPLHLAVGEMAVGDERKFIGILHDLTARVSMEARLREQAAMVRLGEMAAVIAHEVKNPLAGIRGAIQVIGSRLPAGSRDAAVTGDIVSRIDGLNELMKDLLLFARPPQPKMQSVNLAQLVMSTAALLAEDPEAAGVRIEVEGSEPSVSADPDLLRIVFVNLLVNAAHAMKGAGTIRVSLDQVNSRCRVTVTDQGPGIPADVLERVFTPFFTTKARGTGLGLPTAKRLVEAHGGRLDIESPSAGGTVVSIELPI